MAQSEGSAMQLHVMPCWPAYATDVLSQRGRSAHQRDVDVKELAHVIFQAPNLLQECLDRVLQGTGTPEWGDKHNLRVAG